MNDEVSTEGFFNDLLDKFKSVVFEIGSIILDAFFLALWVFIEWLLEEYVIKPLKLSGISDWVLVIFHWGFNLSTLGIVLSFLITDMTIILIRSWRKIKAEFYHQNNHTSVGIAAPSQLEVSQGVIKNEE